MNILQHYQLVMQMVLLEKNQGRKVYINGKYYEIVGRVCMDQNDG